LTAKIGKFVEYYDHQRFHESLDNVTPADVYTGRAAAILERSEGTKQETINRKSTEYRKAVAIRQSAS
jgi:putative transposase